MVAGQPKNAFSLISVAPSGRVTDFNMAQSENALFPIDFTLFGRFNETKEEHFSNALALITVIVSERVKDANFEHPENALSPIVVTPFGSTREVMLERPENVPSFIVTMLPGRTNEVKEEQRENAFSSITEIESGKEIDFNFEQCEKALFPIEVIVLGRDTDANEEQSENAPLLTLVIPLKSSTVTSPLQKALGLICISPFSVMINLLTEQSTKESSQEVIVLGSINDFKLSPWNIRFSIVLAAQLITTSPIFSLNLLQDFEGGGHFISSPVPDIKRRFSSKNQKQSSPQIPLGQLIVPILISSNFFLISFSD